MSPLRVAVLVVLTCSAALSIYLLIVGDEGHDPLRRASQLMTAAGWLVFALLIWRERNRRV